MATYLYFCETCQKEFEASHSIKEELEECPRCKEAGLPANKPKRLVSSCSFLLKGNGWSKDNYSK